MTKARKIQKRLQELVMESYLDENFSGVKPKHSSDEVLQRWRNLCSIVKNNIARGQGRGRGRGRDCVINLERDRVVSKLSVWVSV